MSATRWILRALMAGGATVGTLRVLEDVQAAKQVLADESAPKTPAHDWDASGAGIPLRRNERPAGPVVDTHLVARPDEPEWVVELANWIPREPGTTLGRALAIIWASPSSLAGMILGGLGGRFPIRRDGVLVFEDVRGPAGWVLRTRGYAATTLGHVVLARGRPSGVLMAHELAHTRQAERLGPFMAPLYWALLGRYGYARHPMERAARTAGRRARKSLSPPVPKNQPRSTSEDGA